MRFSGSQVEKIHGAILDGYNHSGLAQALRFKLNVDFEQIVTVAPFSEQVFELIAWAERQGRAEELVAAACEGNPTNARLKALRGELQMEPAASGTSEPARSEPRASPRAAWIELERREDAVYAASWFGHEEKPPAVALGRGITVQRLRRFAGDVARAVEHGEALGAEVRAEAQEIHQALLEGGFARVRTQADGDAPLLVRISTMDPELAAVPWEALCDPAEPDGFWGISPELLPVRGGTTESPMPRRIVPHALKVLAVAPFGADSLDPLKAALSERIAAQEIELLPPIVPPFAELRVLFDRLNEKPHVVHFVGRGGVFKGQPGLQLAEDPEAEGAWVTAAVLGKQIRASTKGSVRLVVLESREKSSDFSGATMILGSSGVDAVIGHLWPLRPDVSRLCSEQFYWALASARHERRGDVAAALNFARLRLFAFKGASAETFSPVLHLRSHESALFEFKATAREPASEVSAPRPEPSPPPPPPLPSAAAAEVAVANPFIERIASKPFSLILGDRWKNDSEWREEEAAFKSFRDHVEAELAKRSVAPPANLPTSALFERAALQLGGERLDGLFQRFFREVARPPLLDALARVLAPGVHVTLLRLPHLEHAIDEAHPGASVYMIQPSKEKRKSYSLFRRPPGAERGAWEELTELSEPFDTQRDFVILRPYRGYTPELLFSSPLITEDDYLFDFRPLEDTFSDPDLAESIQSELKKRPVLITGLSLLVWHHRKLLHNLFPESQLPSGSVAVVDPQEGEETLWSNGTGLPAEGRVPGVAATARQLAQSLEAIAARGGSAR